MFGALGFLEKNDPAFRQKFGVAPHRKLVEMPMGGKRLLPYCGNARYSVKKMVKLPGNKTPSLRCFASK